MKGWLRKLKGALGIGSLWGLAGTILGSAAAVVVTLIGGTPLLTSFLTWGLPMGVVSFVLGTGFAGILGLIERHRTFDQLSPGRAALLGAAVGVAFPVGLLLVALGAGLAWTNLPLAEILVTLTAASGAYGIVTGGLAGATVWIGRKAPAELPGALAADEARLLDEPIDA